MAPVQSIMVSSGSGSIRNVQYEHLIKMLNFNLPEGPNRPIWKLFIMDAAGQRILAPLVKVNDLREHGVTLFLQLKGKRERVPDVPAIYFIEPSPESISLLCQDLRDNVYDSYYLNFTSQIGRDALEELAQVAHQTQTHLKISKIYDQYLNYITLEDNLFNLEIPRTMINILNTTNNTTNTTNITNIVDSTVSGIFSVLMSFECCAPIICTTGASSSNGDLVKLVCGKLESKIKNHLINTKSAISLSNPQTSPNQPRPLLLIVDRRIDLAGPLKHSTAYNALIDEILGLNSNQISIPGGKTFDIDRRDWFWRENSTRSFPKVAEAVESALKLYKTDYDRVLQTTPGMTEELMKNSSNLTEVPNNTATVTSATTAAANSLTPEQLKIAINVLPELTERKRLIDTHLQISTALLESLKSRDLGTLFNIEQEISQSSCNPETILMTLKDSKIGNSQDKLRLLLIYMIYNYKNLKNSTVIQEALDYLKLNGTDLKSFQGVLKCLNVNGTDSIPVSPSSNKSQSPITNPPNPSNITISSNITNITSSSVGFGDLFRSTTNVLVSSVKNLIPSTGSIESPLTKFIDSSYSQIVTGNPSNSNLNVIDPRPSKSNTNLNSQISSIDHIILFVIGGATYSEYDNLLDHFNRNKSLQNLKFTFGVTEILNPKKFLDQLCEQG